MKSLFLVLLLSAVAPFSPLVAQAQTRDTAAEREVMATVQRLFDGMRAGDSAVVRSVFHPEARLLTTGTRDGEPFLETGSIDQFAAAVGTPHEVTFDERIWNVEVRVDDHLATAWMDYAFYLGDRLSHCGVNAFQLFRTRQGWRVIGVTDTRRREGCKAPPAS